MKTRLTLRFGTLVVVVLMMSAGCTSGTDHDPQQELNVHQAEIAEPPSEREATGGPQLRTVYVPAYSYLPSEEGRRIPISILLSVRNMDSAAVITLTHVDFFDTSGHRVRRYLSSPQELRPLETAEFTVGMQDRAGGSGANFLVYWEGPSDAHPLLTETVMWGQFGSGIVSFASRGVELDRRPDPSAFMSDTPMGELDSPPDQPLNAE